MNKDQLPESLEQDGQSLKAQLNALAQELAAIEQKTTDFEAILRLHLADEIIQEIELSALYKAQKQVKKQKRRAQKISGKNFKPSTALKTNRNHSIAEVSKAHVAERKRLYREALLHIHPDKFSMSESDTDIAHSTTTQLIEIFQNGNLEMLQAFHAHIFSGQVIESVKQLAFIKSETVHQNTYLEKEIKKLSVEVLRAKTRITYQVLLNYKEPMLFIQELKTYYHDRISKLKKRTRSK